MRATWRRTATPVTATTSASAWRRDSCCEGTEVKSLRTSGAQLKDGYAAINDGELWLHSVHIPLTGRRLARTTTPSAPQAARAPPRARAAGGPTAERGLTIVPTRIYFSGFNAKVEIALARGKDLYDKRETIRERETKREMERAVREARR